MRDARVMARLVLAAALVLTVLGCTPSAELAARQPAEPEAIAAAVCREVRTEPRANATMRGLPTGHRKSPTRPASTTIAATFGRATG